MKSMSDLFQHKDLIRTNLEGVLKTKFTFNWRIGGMDHIWLHGDDS